MGTIEVTNKVLSSDPPVVTCLYFENPQVPFAVRNKISFNVYRNALRKFSSEYGLKVIVMVPNNNI